MKHIDLPGGHIALIDDDDFERVRVFRWTLRRNKRSLYAQRRVDGGTTQVMHRFILGLTDPAVEVDHRDGNGLNNVRANLRTCTATQNSYNRRKLAPGRTAFKGVNPTPNGTFHARIRKGRELVHLGTYATAVEAALAYNHAATELFGDFAKLNNVRGELPTRLKPNHKGERTASAKLDENSVRNIRKLRSEGHGATELAKIFGVTPTNIVTICKRKSWRHVA